MFLIGPFSAHLDDKQRDPSSGNAVTASHFTTYTRDDIMQSHMARCGHPCQFLSLPRGRTRGAGRGPLTSPPNEPAVLASGSEGDGLPGQGSKHSKRRDNIELSNYDTMLDQQK